MSPTRRIGGAWLIPAELTRQAIYLVRHPLDMLVSYADHWGVGLAEAARQIADPKNAIAGHGEDRRPVPRQLVRARHQLDPRAASSPC